jgi:hypothetical protein
MKCRYVGGKYMYFMTANRVPVRNSALIGLDLLLTDLISIAKRRRKKILTCTQDKTTRAKLE